jgi:hypothetical protein
VTICGFSTARGVAYVWSDGETYRDDEPAGSMEKLVISPGALVGIVTGFASLARQFRDLVGSLGEMSFQGAVAAIPPRLRAARDEKIKSMRALGLAYDELTTYAVVGPSDGGMRGVVCYESRDFEPVEADAWLSPHVDRMPSTSAEVLEAAQAQLRFVRRKCPGASGGKITIAKIGPDGVAQTRVQLLIGDERGAA